MNGYRCFVKSSSNRRTVKSVGLSKCEFGYICAIKADLKRRDKKVECHISIVRFALPSTFSTYVCVLPCSLVSAWPFFCPLTSVNMEECVFNTESVLPETKSSISTGVIEVVRFSQRSYFGVNVSLCRWMIFPPL